MNRDGTLLFTRGGCVSCLRACFGARFLLQSYQYPNLSEGADRVAGQLRGDKECPFSGVTSSGRVWRKVPQSDARSVSRPKLQAALVYDILPSTTAVFSYAIESRKLSSNEQFFGWCSNSNKFVTNNSNKTRRVIYSHQQSLHQHK